MGSTAKRCRNFFHPLHQVLPEAAERTAAAHTARQRRDDASLTPGTEDCKMPMESNHERLLSNLEFDKL